MQNRVIGREVFAAICAVEGLVQNNLFAYTAPGSDVPPYVSINELNGIVTVTVRSPKGIGGATASVVLPEDESLKLREALAAK